MWADLLLAPWIRRQIVEHGLPHDQKAVVVWDNVQFHVSDAVTAVFREHNIIMAMLPKNCTSFLQPMDLVVNAPLKAAVRRMRCEALYDYMQAFQLQYHMGLAQQRSSSTAAGSGGSSEPITLPHFNPPKPTVKEAIITVMTACQTSLATAAFKQSLKKCFVEVGIAPYPEVEDTRSSKERYRNFTTADAWKSTLGSIPWYDTADFVSGTRTTGSHLA
jgi:hypothetical protein